MFKIIIVSLGFLLITGCAAYGVIDNAPLTESVSAESYSMVPLVFHPIVIENYYDCKTAGKPDWMVSATKRMANDPDMSQSGVVSNSAQLSRLLSVST